MRAHPHLYEINTWPWLDALSRTAGHQVTLATVADREWDRLRDQGMDIVYLMGIWKRSAFGRRLAQSEPGLFSAFDRAWPDWRAADVAGSAYCIAGYEPDPRIGTWDDVAAVRAKLHARDMRLVVDFIPNHTGFDHPWIFDEPDRYVQGEESAFRKDPVAFRVVETSGDKVRFVACGRDPCFPPWNDVAQLDYSNVDTRAAMVAELARLAKHADGARCDMAMLVLSDVFGQTWKDQLKSPMPSVEFWTEARAAVPGFMLLAEVYWDLEWRLQQLGFEFTYDKRLYDRMLNAGVSEVRGHLMADAQYQRRSARFIENHDEPRSVPTFGDRLGAAAVTMSSLPGLRFFHQGQFEGRTRQLPVQLGRWADETVDGEIARFYDRLLATVDEDVFHAGEWRLLDVHPSGDDSNADLIAWLWTSGAECRIVVVNLSAGRAQGHVQIGAGLPECGDTCMFEDLLDGRHYWWTRMALDREGLYVRLEKGAAHILKLA